MRRAYDMRSRKPDPGACCQLCEDDSFTDCSPPAVVVLTFGPVWAAVDLALCDSCLGRIDDEVSFAIAKYGSAESGGTKDPMTSPRPKCPCPVCDDREARRVGR